jgi:hypothetical protein
MPGGGYPGFGVYGPIGGNVPPPGGGGVPPYPGPAGVNNAFPYGPSFDGLYSHGLTNNPYTNSLFEDVNATQHQIFSGAGTGYPAIPPGAPLPGQYPPPGGGQPPPGGRI